MGVVRDTALLLVIVLGTASQLAASRLAASLLAAVLGTVFMVMSNGSASLLVVYLGGCASAC